MYRVTSTYSFSNKVFCIAVILLLFIIFFFLNTSNRYSFYEKHEYRKIKVHKHRTTKKTSTTGARLTMKYILLWTNPKNFPFVYFGEGSGVFINKRCQWTNCYVTGDRGFLGDYTEFDAVVFNGPQLHAALANNDLPSRRTMSQKYVYANIESAATYPMCSNTWDDYFNWTWTYKLDSDKIWRYFVVRNEHGEIIGPEMNMHWKNLSDMNRIDNDLKLELKTKKKAAAWFASNCNTVSGRENFVGEVQMYLQKYNLPLDIYGACGPQQCPKQIMNRCLKMLERDYYFYFAFENALSEDYVTEKILYALKHNTVPIVYGGANYSRFMPAGAYLNAQELGPERLADKIYELIHSPDKYAAMFQWKKHYSYHFTHEQPDSDVYCQFCAALNEEDLRTTSLYEHFDSWWTPRDTCKCLKIEGHLQAMQWQHWPRTLYSPASPLDLATWTTRPHIWLHYVESADGLLPDDDVLRTTNPRFWSIHDVQRYMIGELHCEQVLFTCQYPQLRLPTPLGQHLWRANTALKRTPARYLKEFHISLEHTLKKMEADQVQMDRLIISDQIINIERLDHFKRMTFFRILQNILSFQDCLQLVSLENLSCRRLEGVRLLQQLACFNANSLKYLFLWRFVLPNENPILINYSYLTGSGQYIPRPDTKQCFLRSLAELRNLRVLALEYSHLADGSGGALIGLLPVIKRPHFRLQLICREDQTPGRADAALGCGGHDIPDTAWRRVCISCPDLYLLMVFCTIVCSASVIVRIGDYDTVRRFLSPSIPLRETHLQFGIDLDLGQRQHSDLSCFVRHLAYQYANTLVTVSIHQWRRSVFPLRRVFELMPRLTRFFYVGVVEGEVDLRRMLHIIACGVCEKLKQINIQIQDSEARRKYWKDVIKALLSEFNDVMHLFDIDFCLGIYKC